MNSHIEEYLDYYFSLSHAPGFAVLLKGQWGSGKTWFIKKYREQLKKDNQKCLYVSLYGMTKFSEIEDTFFQQLHPILSSHGMAITGKIFKGLLKGTLKIDLDGDSKEDGRLSIQVPDINIPDYLKNTDKSILIFDDLERCQIDISNIMGYINYFVEQQDLKVVIVANEDEISKKDSKYGTIKEKLIGKTFSINPDFDGALEDFIRSIQNLDTKEFLVQNTELIRKIYEKAECDNLRILKQIVLDFERIFNELPEKVKSKPEAMKDILEILIVFSIEIRRATISAKDVSKLSEEYVSLMSKRMSSNLSNQVSSLDSQDNSEELSQIQKILFRYTEINLNELFPSELWWQTFFDKGILDTQELNQSIFNSKYFQDENTPPWIRLWHFQYLTDDEFDKWLKTVESEYTERKFLDFGVIKHITGLLLNLSNLGLFCKNKEEIIHDSKLYINWLKDNNQLEIAFTSFMSSNELPFDTGYKGLGFQGINLKEFQEFCSYFDEVRELVTLENMLSDAQDLLDIMQTDIWKFKHMICISNNHDWEIQEQRYYEIPILQYIDSAQFIHKLLSMKFDDQRVVFWILTTRYKLVDVYQKLLEELQWLKSVRSLLLDEATRRKGKVSGYRLNFLTEHYLNDVIEKLEAKETG
ncbi:P-loop NTPase fold protein [Trichormus variabilis]|uniref:KAP NTPase domain-containing protein n=1 Tax=Trichormus variabilis SAG 1403-4b TaxID=447716 RepID=A0A3S1A9Z4_ANAVA|nr:P-loop NTPase fold protein [Trichormus variabilis]MBD2628092.1 NTPase [Trichormus variabilis FACHB-164]RUS96814.1 hypothetical protein DSM107003_22200 [Trichormus variabilis SAG 1403-4b]